MSEPAALEAPGTSPPAAVASPSEPPAGEPFVDRRLRLISSPALLRWLLVGRILLAIITVGQLVLLEGVSPAVRTAALGVVVAALSVMAYAAWVGLVRRQRASLSLLQVQAVMDLLLVTALVHLNGPGQTGWVALYVLVIAVYGLLMPVRLGLATALLGGALLLADATVLRPGTANPGVWGQIAVFTVVYAVVASLGQRLRVAAMEQTQLESELERVRLEADQILRHIRSGVLTVDGRGTLAFINPTAEQLLDLPAGAHLGRPVLEQLAERAPELVEAIRTGIRTRRRVPRAEGVVQRPAGEPFPIGLSTTTFERETEAEPLVTAIFTDISDLRYLEELRLRTERLEAVAALGASLAHEIRNPLASIRSAVEQLAGSRRDDPDEQVLGGLILRESDRLNRLLGEFLDFSRVRASRFQAVNLTSVVQDAARMVREHPDCGPRVAIEVRGGPMMIQGDEDLLHRVAWNLLLNAAQALKDGGSIIATLDVPDAGELPRGTAFDQPVRLRIADTGPGIDPELQEQLFQPFVSGRPGGSGLGLAIVQRAVEAHRGLVLVDSAPGQGTTFTILLHAKSPSEDNA